MGSSLTLRELYMCGIKHGCVRRVLELNNFRIIAEMAARSGDVQSKYRFNIIAVHDGIGQAVTVCAPNANYKSKDTKPPVKINPDDVKTAVLDHRRRKFEVHSVVSSRLRTITLLIEQVAKGAYVQATCVG